MSELQLSFRLPLAGWPRAVVETDYGYDGGQLSIDGVSVLSASCRRDLEDGLEVLLPAWNATLYLQLVSANGTTDLQLRVDGKPALREDKLRARPVRAAWVHACLALAGSAFGFVASYLYLLKAAHLQSEWASKMGSHMAGWHLLLTFTLFPASVWGQRAGIRAVQFVSFLFFAIHAGIAIANVVSNDAADPGDEWIGGFNALSGILFLAATIYGNRAHRDMDPVAALLAGRANAADE